MSVDARQVVADPRRSGPQRGVGLVGRRMGDHDTETAREHLRVVPRVGRPQAGPGTTGQLGQVGVGAQPVPCREDTTVGIGLHHAAGGDRRAATPLPAPAPPS